MQLEPGTKLGPYEVISSAGAGGMGEVYRAKDTRLDREVALKILPIGLGMNENLKRRFDREAKAISSLNHPHISTLYDVGEHEGTNYLVMEFCEGESLAVYIENRGALPSEELLRYGSQIADALDKAHRQGVVHRDLKPANIMITRSGVKLLDFGLAKYTGQSGLIDPNENSVETALPTQESPLTEVGTIMGTFQYMSPEQLEGLEADSRADIFALGSVLFEMATGRRAFEGKSRASLIAAVLDRQPPVISTIQPMVPPAFDHVVQKCLEKDPEDRWQSAHDVASQLQWIGDAGSRAGIAAPVTIRRKTRERLAWGLAAAALLSTALLGFLYFRPVPVVPIQTVRSFVLPAEGTTFDFTGINVGSLAISPDGRHVAFTALGTDNTRMLWIRSLDTLEAKRLNGTSGAEHPFWSPDSRFVAFFAEGQLKKVDITGAPPLTITDAPNGRSGSWNHDDVVLFSPNTLTPIHRVSAAGGDSAPATELDADLGETTHRWAHFLPDGEHFLFMAATHTLGNRSEANAIFLASLDSKERELLLHARSNVIYASGHLLYVRDSVLVAHAFDSSERVLTGDPVPIAQQVRYDPSFFRGVFSASQQGQLVYQTGTVEAERNLSWLDRKGNETMTLSENTRFTEISLSPTGKQFVGTIADEASGNSDLWIYDLERSVQTRLTFGKYNEFAGTWSPDGQTVAYSVLTDPEVALDVDIHLKSATGDGTERTLIDTETYAIANDWSPDGRYLSVTSFDTSNDGDLSIYPVEGSGEPIDFLKRPFLDSAATFSPDSKWIAYSSDESSRNELYVAPFPGPGGKWQISTQGAVPPAYWLDGEIVFMRPDRSVISVPVTAQGDNFSAGSPEVLFRDGRIQSIEPAADGQSFLTLLNPESGLNTPLTLVTNWATALQR
jgi:Tol biopolymer transport system component